MYNLTIADINNTNIEPFLEAVHMSLEEALEFFSLKDFGMIAYAELYVSPDDFEDCSSNPNVSWVDGHWVYETDGESDPRVRVLTVYHF